MKRNKTIIIVLLLVLTINIYLMYKSSNNKQVTLDNVNLKEQINNMKGIAIMLEQDDGTYKESSTNTFPTDMKFNSVLSGCIDNLGNRIENSLTYENGIANVETSNTSYCYLYFDMPLTIGEHIQTVKPTGYNSTMEAGLYRFQGTTANNYICFGTSDKTTCTENTDEYMYRIIGVDETGRLKLIKKEALNTAYYWHNSSTTNITWPDSDLFKGLNGKSGGKYSNLFIGNLTYIPDEWEDKITEVIWKYGDVTGVSTGFDYYNQENGWTNTTTAKIGLMYIHDYGYVMGGNFDCISDDNYETCQNSWLYIKNNDSSAPAQNYEWYMSRLGVVGSGTYYAYYLAWNGQTVGYNLDIERGVRPVFYLNKDVTIVNIESTGTISDPFIIE